MTSWDAAAAVKEKRRKGMKNFKTELIRKEDYSVTRWSGGTTTELSIAPEGSIYAERNFLWRLSSATVELEESTFTSLPDYNRIIMTLQGGIRLRHNGGTWLTLPEFKTHSFDGGDETVSEGKVVDFNLMLRKGRCEGTVQPMQLKQKECADVQALLKEALPEAEEILVYCWKGDVRVAEPDGEETLLQGGDTLRISGALKGTAWKLCAETAAEVVLSAVHYL